MVEGYFWSILFMMSMPFLILGSLGAYFYYQVRQARALQDAASVPAIRSAPRALTASAVDPEDGPCRVNRSGRL